MAAILGPGLIAQIALPAGLDMEYLARWEMQQGMTFQDFVGRVAAGLGGSNQDLIARWGWLMSATERAGFMYEEGGDTADLVELSELDMPDPHRGELNAHMLPLKAYGASIGGSWRYFRDAIPEQILADISVNVRKFRKNFEKKLLTRLFTNTENLIPGSSGYDVPFVAGTSGMNIIYTPMDYDGMPFDDTHSHFLALDSDTLGLDDAIEQSAAHLFHHGHEPSYTLLASRADAAEYSALPNWVEKVDPGIQVMVRDSDGGARFTRVSSEYDFNLLGEYQSDTAGLVQVRTSFRIPTGYGALVKSYGSMSTQNPLAVRVHPKVGFGAYILPESTNNAQFPLKTLNMITEYGVGVGQDRTNGVIFRLASDGLWSNPTIS